MALADFVFRDEVAISQVLQGFQSDAFTEKLKGLRLAIAFGEDAATSLDGRQLLDLTVRLTARLYPSLTFSTLLGGNQFTEELMALAKLINPNIEISLNGFADVVLSVGEEAPVVDAPTVYAGCEGWLAQVGTKGSYKTSDLGNPFGAGFAACLATANLFRLLFLPDGASLLDLDLSFPADAECLPRITKSTLADPLVLVGVGAVGNSVAWALARTPLVGEIHLVDPEVVELSNLQRYILCGRTDEGGKKVDVVKRSFEGALEAHTHQGTWASFLQAKGYKWERILVALDSAHDRRAVQGSLPRWIANAWTQLGDLGVSTHSFLGQDACLACLYLPTQKSKSEDQIIAEALRIPQYQTEVRVLLGSGKGIEKELCDAIASAWGVSEEALAQYLGRPIRELWVHGICGGGIIPIGEAGSNSRDMHVPLAFQSALTGLLLAFEATRDILKNGAQRKTLVRRLDILRPLAENWRQPALKAMTGLCICEDVDFISAYRAKYELNFETTNGVEASTES